ncbi:MAG: bifunctional diguanylate cyclase/phosphodiesterase [Gammaproteobacteria bacterium]|nr:bifunctional diguanylate cyclase/phosphodiesterase [Gammaproteobacteria bacterium]
MLPRLSLTLTMLLLTTSVGVTVWALSYTFQNYKLNAIFQENLSQRLEYEAQEHSESFYQYINKFQPAVDIYANNVAALTYIQSEQWLNNSDTTILVHKDTPVWLPEPSIMSSYIWPHCAILFDKAGRVRELYHNGEPTPPQELFNLLASLINISNDHAIISAFDNRLFVLSSEKIGTDQNAPTMVIANNIDQNLLNSAQTIHTDKVINAILSVDDNKILVSSNSTLIPENVKLDKNDNKYLSIIEEHIIPNVDNLQVKFVTFMSKDEVSDNTKAILAEERQITLFTAIAYIGSFALLIFWITSRIQNLTSRVVAFSENMEISQPDLSHKNPLVELEYRFELLADAVQSETMALEHQALHDPLTNMPNRKLFNKQLQKQISSCAHSGHNFILILSDLDRFKEINDTLGHHVGDVVLQMVADRIHETLRSDDMVARLGGDEFGILLSHTSIEQVDIILKKIITVFEQPFDIEGHHLDLGLSMGVVEYPLHGEDINILLQRADVAMYNAKNKRSGYSVYSASEDGHAISRLALAAELRKALNNNALRLFYQPKIDLTTGHIYGAEALLRWEHPERGFISPEDFIPLAEHTGLIQPITCWVMDTASKQCATWNSMGHKLLISINISTNCIHDARLPVKLNEIILGNKLTPDQITLEITENIFIKDPVRSKKIMDNINKMGVGLSIDDFGTGYSSLAYLKQLPVNELKIDKSFVMEMLKDENDKIIVRTTIDLAHNLGIKVVAEGVESLEVARQLKELNCDAAQGYYLGRPMEVEDFIKYIKDRDSKIDLS